MNLSNGEYWDLYFEDDSVVDVIIESINYYTQIYRSGNYLYFTFVPVIGIITTLDILRAIKDGKDINSTTIGDIMTVNTIVINQNKDIEETIDIINKNRISMIPVVEDDGRIIGICSRSDILKEILNERFVVIGRKKNYNNNNR